MARQKSEDARDSNERNQDLSKRYEKLKPFASKLYVFFEAEQKQLTVSSRKQFNEIYTSADQEILDWLKKWKYIERAKSAYAEVANNV